MEATRREAWPTAGALVALGLAACAGLSFLVSDTIRSAGPSTEAVFTLFWMGACALLAWAAIAGAVVAVHLVREVASRRRPALSAAVLVFATAAVMTGVILAHPLAS